jgi:GDP-4-dehydro-6-deoxy-D-mannose reductase
MRALVIGADGFAGRWLVRHLVECHDEVIGGVGPRFASPLPKGVVNVQLDVSRDDQVREVVGGAEADVIYYLAGVSAPAERTEVERVFAVSVQGAMSTILAAARQTKRSRVILVGSSHVYGIRSVDHPLEENEPLRPSTAYGAMKAAAEVLALSLGRASGLDVVAARPFNHIGPGQKPSFVAPALARQVSAIRASGQKGSVKAGSLDVLRDFTDVRDVVRAYRLLAMHAHSHEAYNIASGRATSVRDIAEGLIQLGGIDANVVADESLSRPGEPPQITGDATKIRRATGWSPEIPLRETLRDLLDSVETRAMPETHASTADPDTP